MPLVSCVWKWIGRPISSFSALHQRGGRPRPADAGHVLDAEDVHAGLLELLREVDVVLERVLARAVEQVAGVADRAFAERAGLEHGVDRHAHVLDPVERIEDAEEVDAALAVDAARCLLDEVAHDVVGVVGVADRVRGAQQHLEQHVGHRFAQLVQPLPRVFLEEAHGDVEGGAAPAFQREQLRRQARVGGRDAHHVGRAHARGEQRLVRVAHRRVGEQHPRLGEHPLRELLRAEFAQAVAGARQRLAPCSRPRASSGARATGPVSPGPSSPDCR